MRQLTASGPPLRRRFPALPPAPVPPAASNRVPLDPQRRTRALRRRTSPSCSARTASPPAPTSPSARRACRRGCSPGRPSARLAPAAPTWHRRSARCFRRRSVGWRSCQAPGRGKDRLLLRRPAAAARVALGRARLALAGGARAAQPARRRGPRARTHHRRHQERTPRRRCPWPRRRRRRSGWCGPRLVRGRWRRRRRRLRCGWWRRLAAPPCEVRALVRRLCCVCFDVAAVALSRGVVRADRRVPREPGRGQTQGGGRGAGGRASGRRCVGAGAGVRGRARARAADPGEPELRAEQPRA